MGDASHGTKRRFGAITADALNRHNLEHALRRALETGAPLLVTYANAHNVNVASTDGAYREALDAFDIIFPEGEGLARAARFLGYAPYEKFHTTDFWPLLFPLFKETGASLFLLGSTRSTLATAQERIEAIGISVAGAADGFGDAERASETVRAINASGARVLLVGMGVPLQEQWVAGHSSAFNPMIVICVGNYFEFFSGTVARAPRFMRKLGLEWLHRLAVEPRRLWKRYVLGIPRFWKIIRRQRRETQ